MTDIAIIGGGASGMAAALAARRAGSGLSVTLLERQSRVGRKLLSTGNGRCNITNVRCADEGVYNTPFASRVIARAGLEVVLAFFRDMGLNCVFDGEGRAYPESDQASSVVDALRLTIEETSVEVRSGCEARGISRARGGFNVSLITGESLFARRVIVACGGMAGEKLGGGPAGYNLLGSLGHAVTPLYPSLTQLRAGAEEIKALKGVRRKCEIALEIDGREVRREVGEILFGDGVISGIAAMALSREAGRALAAGKKVCAVARVSDLSKDELMARAGLLGARRLEDFLSGVMPKRLGQQLLKHAGIVPLSRECASVSPREAAKLAETLGAWRIPIAGVNGFADAQVTSGGAAVTEFKDDLESLKVPGLYAAGETLDVDGPCGGFNLHWAWASGIVSGESAARSLRPR